MRKRGEYPFLAQAPVGRPRPTEAVGLGHFIAAPVSAKTAFWGFEVATDRDLFLETYCEAKPVSIKWKVVEVSGAP
ncbi:hypothetical protein [Shimia sp.]|uniref:hypothetical protein n=1 Tax=Shimia sp. TaxID=1954381 RepID=UPI003299C4BD